MIPNKVVESWRWMPRRMLNPAKMRAAPTKMVQNILPGIHEGTIRMTSLTEDRWSAPKMTRGMA